MDDDAAGHENAPLETKSDNARPPSRRRIRNFSATITEVVRETRDTVTLVLKTGERAQYSAGQFLTIDPHQFEDLQDLVAYFEDMKERREPPRAYSMCSSPLEPALAITVKEERYVRGTTKYPPLLSPYLARRARRGQTIIVVGFTGAYVLPRDVEARTDHVVHVVAGSGSVPSYAIAKYALAAHPLLHQTFVYSNRTWEDVIFREALETLACHWPMRFRVLHTLTREVDAGRHGPEVRSGRVGPELLREAIPDPGTALVYACGPANGPHERAAARARGQPLQPRFLESIVAALASIGVPREHVTTEAYG